MMKIIDLNQTILSLIQEDPEIKDILFELGFKDIIKPGILTDRGSNHDDLQGFKNAIH